MDNVRKKEKSQTNTYTEKALLLCYTKLILIELTLTQIKIVIFSIKNHYCDPSL